MRVSIAAILLLATTAWGWPTLRYDVDVADGERDRQFHVYSSVLSTPVLEFSLKEGQTAYTPTNNAGVRFSYGKDDNANAMVHIGGSIVGDKAIFQVATNDFALPVQDWYAVVVLTNTSGQAVSYARGRITLRRSPEVSTPGILNRTFALNWDEIGPYSGTPPWDTVTATWGAIAGTLTNQTDLVAYIASNAAPFTGTTDDVPEGTTNLYFTAARVSDKATTGQVAAVESSLAGYATGTPLYVESDPVWVAERAGYVETATVDGGPYYDSFFTWTFISAPVGVPDTSSIITNMDQVIRSDIFNGSKSDYVISYPFQRSTGEIATIIIESDTIGVATATEARVYHVSDGAAVITAAINGFSRSTNLIFSTDYAGTNQTIIGGVDGTFRHAVSVGIDARTSGAVKEKEVYSISDFANTNYVRNPNSWVYGLDLTCESPYNSSWGFRFPATLISPDVVANASHFGIYLSPGAVVHFVDMTNGVYTRTVSAIARVNPDIMLGRLDSPLPDAVKPAALMPPDRSNYIVAGASRLPGIWIDRHNRAWVQDLVPPSYNPGWWGSYWPPQLTNRVAYTKWPVNGDSGSKLFLVSTNDVRPIMILHSSTTMTGPDYGYVRGAILDQIIALGGDTNIVLHDMSPYTSYMPALPE